MEHTPIIADRSAGPGAADSPDEALNIVSQELYETSEALAVLGDVICNDINTEGLPPSVNKTLDRSLSLVEVIGRSLKRTTFLLDETHKEIVQERRARGAIYRPDYDDRAAEWRYQLSEFQAAADRHGDAFSRLLHTRVPDLTALREKVRIGREATQTGPVDLSLLFTQLLADIDGLN